MRAAVAEYLSPVLSLVGEYLTLDEMRNEKWNISRRLLRERLSIEYPTLEAMYASGFTTPRSILKRKLTIDPTTIKRGEDIDLTPEEVNSIAADILLYGVPDEYITNPNLYEGLPTWLQLVIFEPIIDTMSTDMIRKFFSIRAPRPGKPATITGIDEASQDLMVGIAQLMYNRKLLDKHPELWRIMFDRADPAEMYQVVRGIMRAGYQPSFIELPRLLEVPHLLERALDGIPSTIGVSLRDFIGTMECLQREKIKTPKLVKFFAERRDEVVEHANQDIERYEVTNTTIECNISKIKAKSRQRPLSGRERFDIREMECEMKHTRGKIERARNKVTKLIMYWNSAET